MIFSRQRANRAKWLRSLEVPSPATRISAWDFGAPFQRHTRVRTPLSPLRHPENHGPDSPFSQPAAPNPAKPPAEELTEFFTSLPGEGVI